MTRRPKPSDTRAHQVEAVKKLLDEFLMIAEASGLREQVLGLVPAFANLRALGVMVLPSSVAGNALARLEHYFKSYPLTVIDGDELAVVAGISEWARRVRELRVQAGWWIYSGNTLREIVEDDPWQLAAIEEASGTTLRNVRPDQYILVRSEQDRDAAHRWHLSNSIRRSDAAVRDKLLAYFRANVGRVVSGEELRYVAGDAEEWTRRTRELRTEQGWPIVTKMQGRSDIPVGAYLLEEDKQAPAHDRQIPDNVRVTVLERDRFRCTRCNWERSMISPEDPRKLLELHHLLDHVRGGRNVAENLITLCNVDHDLVHSGKLLWQENTWVTA